MKTAILGDQISPVLVLRFRIRAVRIWLMSLPWSCRCLKPWQWHRWRQCSVNIDGRIPEYSGTWPRWTHGFRLRSVRSSISFPKIFKYKQSNERVVAYSVYVSSCHVVTEMCPHVGWQIGRWSLFHGSESTYRTDPCQSSWERTRYTTLNVSVHRRTNRFLFTRPSSTAITRRKERKKEKKLFLTLF